MIRYTQRASAIALFLSALACSPGAATGPDNGGNPGDPPPIPDVIYDVTLSLTRVVALGNCDGGEVVLGVPVGGPGEFAYTIWVDVDGQTLRRVETPAYGQRGTGTASVLIDNFGHRNINETVRFARSARQSFTLGIGGIEWDGVVLTVRDAVLDGDVRQRPFSMDEISGVTKLDLTVGNGDQCGLKLEYSVTAEAR